MLSFACQVSAKSKETVIHTTEIYYLSTSLHVCAFISYFCMIQIVQFFFKAGIFHAFHISRILRFEPGDNM